MLNEGYLKAKRTPESDLVFTPAYAVKPLLKYIKPNSTIWCPFDTSDSEFVKIFAPAVIKLFNPILTREKISSIMNLKNMRL